MCCTNPDNVNCIGTIFPNLNFVFASIWAARPVHIESDQYKSCSTVKQGPAVGATPSTPGRPVSRDLFEFGSTFATTLAVSEAYPTTELAACSGRVIDPKHQIVYLAHVTRCRRCSEMRSPGRDLMRERTRLSGAEPVWIQTAARRSHKLHLICCDAWPIRYHYWTDDCIDMITRMTMHYFKCNRMENDNILLSHTCNPANGHALK